MASVPALARSTINPDDDLQEEDSSAHPRLDAESASMEDALPNSATATQLQLNAIPEFKPFFTLVEDTQTGEHYHPNVYYVFADDDPDVVVSATLSALDAGESQTNNHHEDGSDRILLVDMAANGKDIQRAVSLSPNWQALSTQVTPAPSWGDNAREADRGLMLTIAGRETGAAARGIDTAKMKGADRSESLIRIFEQRLDELHAVLGQLTVENEAEP